MKVKRIEVFGMKIMLVVITLLLCGCGNQKLEIATETESDKVAESEKIVDKTEDVKSPTPTIKATPTPIEGPSDTDVYFEALNYIDEVISESAMTKKYSNKSYEIKGKSISKEDGIVAGDFIYTVKYVIKFDGVAQQYVVTLKISAIRQMLTSKYTYSCKSKSIAKGSSL